MYPLFRHFPKLEVLIPRYPLVEVITPVQQLGNGIWIKRDDLTNPIYGGNKTRKLELILGRAVADGVDRIVTFGAIGTNHGVATTVFARRAGIATTVILFDQPVTPVVHRNLAVMVGQGAELWYRKTLARAVLSYYLESRLRHRGALRLFAGGSGLEGTLAFVSAFLELADQVRRGECPLPDRIVVPVGSSATLAGLAVGAAMSGASVVVEGVRVAPARLGPFGVCTPESVRALIKLVLRFMADHGISVPEDVPFEFNEREYGAGYGDSTPSSEVAKAVFASLTGLPMEGTYTAKAFSAALSRHGGGGERVLYWHTFNSADTGPLIDEGGSGAGVPVGLRAIIGS